MDFRTLLVSDLTFINQYIKSNKIKQSNQKKIGPSANYYESYNFEREPWWPKFEVLRNKYGIKIVKGDKKLITNKTHQSRAQTHRQQPQQQEPIGSHAYQNMDEIAESTAQSNNQPNDSLAKIMQQGLPNQIVKPPIK